MHRNKAEKIAVCWVFWLRYLLCRTSIPFLVSNYDSLFLAALAYLQYQRILNVDWHKVHAVSQTGIDWVADALTHVSSTMGASHTGTLSNIGIPLASSVSAGFVLGMVRG